MRPRWSASSPRSRSRKPPHESAGSSGAFSLGTHVTTITTRSETFMSFRALMLEKQDGGPLAHIVDLEDAALSTPEALASDVTAGDVLIRVDWSTINYKDGLAITGRGPVVRKWPMVAGIDG